MYYYSFDIDKWIKRTYALTPEEKGVYLTLINHYYMYEKPLVNDVRELARDLGLLPHIDSVEYILRKFFEETPEGWKNDKCEQNIDYVNKKAAISRANGQKGGRPRSQNNPETTQKEPTQNPEETQRVSSGVPSGNPDHNPEKSHYATVTTVTTPKGNGAKAPCARFEEFWLAYPRDRRRDKKKALATWKRRNLDSMADLIIADVKNRVDNDDQWIRGFSPQPTTYLNGDRWEDELGRGQDDKPKKWETGI